MQKIKTSDLKRLNINESILIAPEQRCSMHAMAKSAGIYVATKKCFDGVKVTRLANPKKTMGKQVLSTIKNLSTGESIVIDKKHQIAAINVAKRAGVLIKTKTQQSGEVVVRRINPARALETLIKEAESGDSITAGENDVKKAHRLAKKYQKKIAIAPNEADSSSVTILFL